jgi:hypothetical protein
MRPIASSFLTLLVAACVAGCGGARLGDAPDSGGSEGRDSGGSAGEDGGASATGFRLGAYDNCFATTFLGTPGGGGTTEHGGGVTLAQSGSVLTVSYGADGGLLDTSLEFTQSAGAAATLRPGQQVDGIQVVCAPLESAPSVAPLAAGSLTYNEGTLFLSVIGTAEPVDAGGGCTNPGGPASLAITCSDDFAAAGEGIDAGSNDGALGGDFVGVYSCASSVVSASASVESAAAGSGALTITETGGVLTAAYAKDPYVQGSLAFVATTGSAALPAVANETMQVVCIGASVPSDFTPSSLPVTSSTLTIDGSSAVLSFVGTLASGGSGCVGAETTVSLLCGK